MNSLLTYIAHRLCCSCPSPTHSCVRRQICDPLFLQSAPSPPCVPARVNKRTAPISLELCSWNICWERELKTRSSKLNFPLNFSRIARMEKYNKKERRSSEMLFIQAQVQREKDRVFCWSARMCSFPVRIRSSRAIWSRADRNFFLFYFLFWKRPVCAWASGLVPITSMMVVRRQKPTGWPFSLFPPITEPNSTQF